MLKDEFPYEYMENAVRNWLKIQQDVAFIKKNFKSGALPSREMVKSIAEKKFQDHRQPKREMRRKYLM